jgi:hypothetical protein
VVVTHLQRDFEVGATESNDEFHAGIAFVTQGLPAEVGLDARWVLRPVCGFVRECRIEALSVAEKPLGPDPKIIMVGIS